MSKGHPEYLKLLDEMRALHIRKATDYGGDSDPLLNIRAGAELVGIPPWQGAMLRANDKVIRIKQFIKKGTLANEGVEDSLMDLAAYALLALVLMRESRPASLEKCKRCGEIDTHAHSCPCGSP